MRFVRARLGSSVRIGVVDDENAVTLARAVSALEPYLGKGGTSLKDLGREILADRGPVVSLPDLDLLAPVRPTSVRDFMIFEEHISPSWRAAGMSRGPSVWYQQPVGYFSNAASVLGPYEPVAIPGGSKNLDFELEVGAVIGQEARSIRTEDAHACIAGYVIMCDWSARDLQSREMTGMLGPFKGKDFATSIGPMLVTPDTIEPHRSGSGYDLRMTSLVNGHPYGTDSWSSATWSFEELLSYSSWNSVVEKGALIGSGTCQGGCILELATRYSEQQYPWLAAGDTVTLAIESMGEVVSTIKLPERGTWPGVRKSDND